MAIDTCEWRLFREKLRLMLSQKIFSGKVLFLLFLRNDQSRLYETFLALVLRFVASWLQICIVLCFCNWYSVPVYAMLSKMKLSTRSYEQRLEMIKFVEKNEQMKMKDVALHFEISRQTLSDILKKRIKSGRHVLVVASHRAVSASNRSFTRRSIRRFPCGFPTDVEPTRHPYRRYNSVGKGENVPVPNSIRISRRNHTSVDRPFQETPWNCPCSKSRRLRRSGQQRCKGIWRRSTETSWRTMMPRMSTTQTKQAYFGNFCQIIH